MTDKPVTEQQANNPTHGVTLEAMLTELVGHYQWAGLASRISVRCFSHDPSIKSSLAFLRRTPWARDKVEALYVQMKKPKRSFVAKPAAVRTPEAASEQAPRVLFAKRRDSQD